MQAITSPTPEPPIALSPLPPVAERGRGLAIWGSVAGALLVGATAGYLVASAANVVPEPSLGAPVDLHSTISWMFDAALAHEAVDESGDRVEAALAAITVESVDVLDDVAGPIVAVVTSPVVGLSVYEISVTRDELDWRVQARRLEDSN